VIWNYNIDEILALAEQIERNGIEYYTHASQLVKSDEQKRTLQKLAEMERDHEKTFSAMRESQLSQYAAFDPDGEVSRYLKAIVDGKIFDYTDLAVKELSKLSVADIYRKAIDLEKDSIIFYLGIQELVPERFGKTQIGRIISEEMSHITLLSNDLAEEMGRS
jgi:rubrerythrin